MAAPPTSKTQKSTSSINQINQPTLAPSLRVYLLISYTPRWLVYSNPDSWWKKGDMALMKAHYGCEGIGRCSKYAIVLCKKSERSDLYTPLTIENFHIFVLTKDSTSNTGWKNFAKLQIPKGQGLMPSGNYVANCSIGITNSGKILASIKFMDDGGGYVDPSNSIRTLVSLKMDTKGNISTADYYMTWTGGRIKRKYVDYESGRVVMAKGELYFIYHENGKIGIVGGHSTLVVLGVFQVILPNDIFLPAYPLLISKEVGGARIRIKTGSKESLTIDLRKGIIKH